MLPAAVLFSLPASALAVRVLLFLHIAAGATALLAGLVPMLGHKGGPWHVRAGRIYATCMVAVALTAVGLCLLQPITLSRLFLTGIAVLSFYLSFTGWRAARRRSAILPLPDQLLAIVSLLAGLLMVGTGVRLQATLFTFFGGLLSLFAGLDTWRSLRPRTQAEPWLVRHFTRLGGSYISAATAFVVVNSGRWLPAEAPAWTGLVAWLAPTLIGSLLIARAVRHYRLRRPAAGAVVLLALLSALLPARAGQAQPAPVRQLTGVITDSAARPLPFATVGVVGKGVGTVADADGRFQLMLPASVVGTDTLRFALLGYASRCWAVAGLPAAPLTVALSEKKVALPAVAVKARGLDTMSIGNSHYRTRLQTNFALGGQPGLNVGSEIGRVFQLPHRGAWLEEFMFILSANDFDTVQLRINVYQLRNGVPAEPLLRQPLYQLIARSGSRRVRVDLRQENLFAHDEIAIAVEWVGHSRRGKQLALPLLMPAFGTHLYRYGAANRWKRFPGMSTTMQLMVLK